MTTHIMDTEGLSSTDLKVLDAVEGWLMLGNYVEANNEIGQISDEHSNHPAVLASRLEIYKNAEWWESACLIARVLCTKLPDIFLVHLNYANALQKHSGNQDALDYLLSIKGQFPNEPLLHYSAACYASELGLLRDACRSLLTALESKSAQLKHYARQDQDLEKLRAALVTTNDAEFSRLASCLYSK